MFKNRTRKELLQLYNFLLNYGKGTVWYNENKYHKGYFLNELKRAILKG
tara:strand:- start:218 stop:364 length:147 start_codon:yes stop_codon:yes gene_type:complete